MGDTRVAASVNTLASFLAFEQVSRSLTPREVWQSIASESNSTSTDEIIPVDVVVICASAVLYMAEEVFSVVAEYAKSRDETKIDETKTDSRVVLVLCGGVGHSTQLMHEAVAAHPRFRALADQVAGQPEARILQAILERCYGLKVTEDTSKLPGFAVLVEDQSTNCGANASKTREVLENHGIMQPRSIIVSQDPTMCRRTIASFKKVYSNKSDSAPSLFSWPTFVPLVSEAQSNSGSTLKYDVKTMGTQPDLWELGRFIDLLLGEIPRLRDSEEGYGPKGKGFIGHVDIPTEVESAYNLVTAVDKYGSQTR